MKKIHNKLNIKDIFKNKLFSNMSWLFVLNFSNTIIPYFTFPYIARVLTPAGYGNIAFALAFIAYFQTFVDYGFNLTGARSVARSENNKQELSKIYSQVFTIKICFFLICIPIIILATCINSKLNQVKELIYIFTLLILGNVTIQTWFFQGLQKAKYMTVISIIIRTIFLVSVFTLVKNQQDIIPYSIIYSMSFILIGITTMLFIRYKLKIKFCKVKLIELKQLISEGGYVFISTAIISIIGTTGAFVLGIFDNAEVVGYYSGMQKIIQVITLIYYPIGQALFPYNSQKYKENFCQGYSTTKKVFKITVPLFIMISISIMLFRSLIVKIALGDQYLEYVNLLLILCCVPITSIISNFLGTQILVASGHNKEYSKAFIESVFIYIGLYVLLGYKFSIWGVATARVLGEIFNIAFLYWEVRKIQKQERKNLIEKDNVYSVS